MARAIINVVLRSQFPVEVEPGIYDYKYTVLKNLKAERTNYQFGFSDNNSINVNTSSTFSFSTVIPQEKSDGELAFSIHYVEYNKVLYEVSTTTPYPPRVKIVIGGISKKKLTDIIEGYIHE